MPPTRYRIEFAESVVDDLRVLPRKVADQIIRKISRLGNGLHGDIKRLQNADVGYRLRMGNYRLSFDTGSYFETLGTETFYPEVSISFVVDDRRRRSAVPVLEEYGRMADPQFLVSL